MPLSRGFVNLYTSEDQELLGRIINDMFTAKYKNIVQLEEFFKTAQNLYLVTEYCGGGNL